jgi:heme/copper-type cytochrome/quinol oxidase subunit 4
MNQFLSGFALAILVTVVTITVAARAFLSDDVRGVAALKVR